MQDIYGYYWSCHVFEEPTNGYVAVNGYFNSRVQGSFLRRKSRRSKL